MQNLLPRLAAALFVAALVVGWLMGSRPPSPTSTPPAATARDPLPSWNAGPTRQAIVDFVARVTADGGADFVPPAERIAVFDNDGTLWVEQPLYVQGVFLIDRVKQLAPAHPAWAQRQPFKGVLEADAKAVAATGMQGIVELVAATHAHTTTVEFDGLVRDWLGAARHPRFGRPYTELVYQPMRELIAYLEANAFRVFLVSGGGVEFMRPWAERAYGIPPERIVGSRIRMTYAHAGGEPVLRRLGEVDLVDDGPGKPVGIQQVIGRRPIAAFGNSDGDYEMLEWTTAGGGARLGVLVHHTDGDREFAYDRAGHVGRLARGLDDAPRRGWIVVDIKRDWNRVFSFDGRK